MAHKSILSKGNKAFSSVPSLFSFSRFLQTQTHPIQQNTSFLQKTRRLKERALVRTPLGDEYIEVAAPLTLGNEPEINWAFATYGVAPEKSSTFRNLNLRRYVVYSKSLDRKNKVVLVDVKQTSASTHTVGQGNFTADNFSQIVEKIQEHFENATELFMQDGTVGAHRSSEVRVRVMTDTSSAALVAKHLLSPARLVAKSPRLFQPDIKVWFAPSFQLQNPASFGIKSSTFIAYNPSTFEVIVAGTPSSQVFVEALGEFAALKAVQLVKPAVSFDGTTTIKEIFDKLIPYDHSFKTNFPIPWPNSNFIRRPLQYTEIGVLGEGQKMTGRLVLSDVVAMFIENSEKRSRDIYLNRNAYPQVYESAFIESVAEESRPALLPLTGDAILHSDNKSTTLIINQNNLFLKSNISSNLYGAHNLFWTSNGLVRGWQGVSKPTADASKLSFGDVAEKTPNGTRAVVSLKTPNVLSHPTNIVFFVSDSKGALPTLGKLNSTQAAKFFTAGYNGNDFTPFYNSSLGSFNNPAELSSFFKNHVEAGKVNVFVVNSINQKREMSSADLQKIFNAVVDGSAAKASTRDGKLFNAVTSLSGVANLESGNAATLEQELDKFLQTKFPNVTF